MVLKLVILVLSIETAASQVNSSFTFNIARGGNTSAGVFAQNGALVKTLWNGAYYKPGTYKQFWDGTDDNGTPAANGNYNVHIVSNNINYTWEGVIGNTSAAQTGPSVHRGFQGIYAMAFAGGKGFYANNYNEQLAPINTFAIANPQSKTPILDKGGVTAFAATDGNYVFWDGMDANDTAKTYVYATKVSDNSEVTSFQYGSQVPVLYSRTYANAIDVSNDNNSKISGLAVQKNGGFLFVSHRNQNQVHVLNKATGAVVQILNITSPGALAVDGNDALWIASGTSVSKYNVNASGTLSNPQLSLTGFASPLAQAVSPDGNTIVVADGGASQQLKAYNNATGALLWVYGTYGGYATDPAVSNNKFYFADFEGVHTFIQFAPDGSFWVGDPGNCRAQHYTAARTFIERIMYLPHFYSCVVDPNNPTRAFANYLEFKIDYSKNLSPLNGSWTLVKNWGYSIANEYNDQFFRFRNLTTLKNGHTYAFLRHNYNLAVVELPKTGGLRYTGIEFPNLNYQLFADGSLKGVTLAVIGKPTVWTSQALTGFDAANNPLWGASKVIATSPPATSKDPVYYGSGNSVVTSSNILVSFDAGLPPYSSLGYHLGGIKIGDNKWLWRTANSTFKQYSGPYPADGAYDIGNGVQYAGILVRALDSTVLWGYHGEFWKNAEVNKWTQVNDDGLFLGQFGVAGPQYTYGDAVAMMAGNVLSASVVKDSAGNAYVYLNDEATHGGLHRWKITGLNSIVKQTVAITLSKAAGGLAAQYFKSPDLNTVNIAITDIDPQVNIVNTTPLKSINLPVKFSTRWLGFVASSYSENYTFYAKASGGVRLWINDSLLIDKWDNSRINEFSGRLSLLKNQKYSIKMEYYNTASQGATALLQWSSLSQAKAIIPPQSLFPADIIDTSAGIDLMEGLPFASTLANKMYGWSRYPADEDYTNYYQKWWTVTSGYNSYNKFQSPDVYMRFEQNVGNYAVNRDLGTNTGLVSWKLTGIVDFTGNFENAANGSGGMYIAVLDSGGHTIAKFYPRVETANPSKVTIVANNKVLKDDIKANIEAVMYMPQPFSISAVNGLITFNYANYAPVTANVAISTSIWNAPKTLRFYFFGNGNNYNRVIDIKNFRFFKTSGTSSFSEATISNEIKADNTQSNLIIYPNPVDNILTVSFPAIVNKGFLKIISSDGKLVKSINLTNQSTQASINVSLLAPGVYILSIVNNGIISSKQFLKI